MVKYLIKFVFILYNQMFNNMSVKTILAIFTTTLIFGSCALLNQPGTADDDVYFSNSNSSSNGQFKIPKVDLEKIKRENPSLIDTTKPSGYNNFEETTNPRAVLGYPTYKSEQDSIYKQHPEYSGYYQPYSIPPFSLREEYLRIKAERRQQRRLARINNRSNYGYSSFYNNGFDNWGNNNWGVNNFNNPWYGNSGWGFNNNWGPSFNFGWNSFNGWNTGIGFGCNNFNNPWAFNNFYNPWGFNGYNHWGFYNNYYPSGNAGVDNKSSSGQQGQNAPRQVIGSNLPSTNGGTIDNPNPNPLKYAPRATNRNGEVLDNNQGQPNQVRVVGSGGTLINTENGVQYVAPISENATQQGYSTYDRSIEQNNSQKEYRRANPQYAAPAPVPAETPRVNNSNYSQPNYNYQPSNSQPTYSQPSNNYNPPVYTKPSYDTPRSNGSFNGGSGSSGGGGGRSSSGGGSNGGTPVSRPR
jgi:hypothetical protein